MDRNASEFSGLSNSYRCPRYIERLINKLDSLELLNDKKMAEITDFVSNESPDTKAFVKLTKNIVKNKYTYLGSKDYLYCLLETNSLDEEFNRIYVQCIADIAEESERTQEGLVSRFVSCFLYSTVISQKDLKSTRWSMFSGGLWRSASSAIICNQIRSCCRSDSIADAFGMPSSKLHSLVEKICSKIDVGRISQELYFEDFNTLSDDKNKTFGLVTGNCYDIENLLIRKGLPSDLCTLRSQSDVDHVAWTSKRDEMLKSLTDWMPADVLDTYLNILACSISEFKPRYAVVNCGTGSDGKTTFFLILRAVFGAYCAICPSRGPATESKNANDATPLANMLVGKRLCLTADVQNLQSLFQSAGFKGITGGDPTYLRGLHQEAAKEAPRLKMLALVNANVTRIPLAEVNEITRIKVVKWENKTVSDSDKILLPIHKLKNCKKGDDNYAKRFISNYSTCLLTELIARHMNIVRKGGDISICKTIIEWTRMTTKPITISSFLKDCVEDISESQSDEYDCRSVIAQLDKDLCDSDDEENTNVYVQTLFSAYMTWRKGGSRFNRNDPTDLETFVSHLSFYKEVITDEEGSRYVKDIRIKSAGEILSSFSSRNYIEGRNRYASIDRHPVENIFGRRVLED